MRVNGLYGHVRSNDVRSVALFAGFVAAFHLLAMLALLVPLAMVDPGHAPLYGWTGYLLRWVPIVTVIGLGIALLIGGAVATESVFAIPGLGRLTIDAILQRDYPVIQAVVLLFSVVYVLVNLAVDVFY